MQAYCVIFTRINYWFYNLKQNLRCCLIFSKKNSPTLAFAPPTRYVNPFPAAAATTELSLSMRLNAAPLFCYLTRYGLDVHSEITTKKRTPTDHIPTRLCSILLFAALGLFDCWMGDTVAVE